MTVPIHHSQSRKANVRTIKLDLPPTLAMRINLICARTGIKPELLIIDILSDSLGSELVQVRHAVSAA